jgi:hypothetical protein
MGPRRGAERVAHWAHQDIVDKAVESGVSQGKRSDAGRFNAPRLSVSGLPTETDTRHIEHHPPLSASSTSSSSRAIFEAGYSALVSMAIGSRHWRSWVEGKAEFP